MKRKRFFKFISVSPNVSKLFERLLFKQVSDLFGKLEEVLGVLTHSTARSNDRGKC